MGPVSDVSTSYFRNGTAVGEFNPCDKPNLPECKYEFNGTMVPYHTNETCTVQEFAKCAEKCPEASCQFVKYTHNQVMVT